MKADIRYFLITILLITYPKIAYGDNQTKIGLLAPFSGEFQNIGKSVLSSARIALNKINNNNISILPRDTKGENNQTLKQVEKLYNQGVRIFIGPVFNKNLNGLDKFENAYFLSLTNKILKNPRNVISAGINARSQFNAIKKYQTLNNLKKTLILIPKKDYKEEIELAIKETKINHDRAQLDGDETTRQQLETKLNILVNKLAAEFDNDELLAAFLAIIQQEVEEENPPEPTQPHGEVFDDDSDSNEGHLDPNEGNQSGHSSPTNASSKKIKKRKHKKPKRKTKRKARGQEGLVNKQFMNSLERKENSPTYNLPPIVHEHETIEYPTEPYGENARQKLVNDIREREKIRKTLDKYIFNEHIGRAELQKFRPIQIIKYRAKSNKSNKKQKK